MENYEIVYNVLNIFEKNNTKELLEEEIEWDSLNMISIMAILTEHFSINEKPENLEKLIKFKDLFEYLNLISKNLLIN